MSYKLTKRTTNEMTDFIQLIANILIAIQLQRSKFRNFDFIRELNEKKTSSHTKYTNSLTD